MKSKKERYFYRFYVYAAYDDLLHDTWTMYKLRNLCGDIYRFIDFICQIARFVPVLWRCYDFDGDSVLKVLRHQLSRLRVCMENETAAPHVGIEKDIKQIKTCETLIDRILADKYTDKLWEEKDRLFGNQFGDIFNEDSTAWKAHSVDKDGEVSSWTYQDLRELSKKEKERESAFIRRIGKIHQQLVDQDKEMLFSLLRKHLKSWWV